MTRAVFRIILRMVVVAALVSTAVFFVLQVLPGDPSQVVVGMDADPEAVARVRARMGLDRPLLFQYADWTLGVVRGDLGTSLTQHLPVGRLIAERLPLTLRLAGLAFPLVLTGGVALALISGRNRWSRAFVRAIEYLVIATPQFLLALVLLDRFAFRRNVIGMFPDGSLRSLVAPALVLAAGSVGIVSRALRAGIDEQLTRPYVVAAHSYGLPTWRVFRVHVLPGAIVPAVSLLGIIGGYLLAGAIVVEEVFGLAGVGRLALTALAQRDLPLIRGVVFVFGLMFPLLNGVSDLLLRLLDPRASLEAGAA